ncbi:MAG: hypothetical protein M9894_20490 [Planctomycetes bacterium]|nr:hypothetical protein [Planctomycetota bacterium]
MTDVRRWGAGVCVRATLAAARLALPAWTGAFPADHRPGEVLALVVRWLDDAPDDAAAAALDARAAGVAAELAAEDAGDLAASWGASLAEEACVLASLAARALQVAARDDRRLLRVHPEWLGSRPPRARRVHGPPSLVNGLLMAVARAARARRTTEDVVRRAVNADVAGWALRVDLDARREAAPGESAPTPAGWVIAPEV